MARKQHRQAFTTTDRDVKDRFLKAEKQSGKTRQALVQEMVDFIFNKYAAQAGSGN